MFEAFTTCIWAAFGYDIFLSPDSGYGSSHQPTVGMGFSGAWAHGEAFRVMPV